MNLNFIRVALTTVIVSVTATSCLKEEIQPVTHGPNLEILEKEKKGPNPWACIGADFLGALAGGTEAAVIPHPAAVFLGATFGGVCASVSLFRTMEPGVNPYPWTGEPDSVGEAHNLACLRVVADPDRYFGPDGLVRQETYRELMVERFGPESDAVFAELDAREIEKRVRAQQLEGGPTAVGDPVLAALGEEFLSGLEQCGPDEEAFQYIREFRQRVEGEELTDTQRLVMSNALSVAEWSTYLWWQ